MPLDCNGQTPDDHRAATDAIESDRSRNKAIRFDAERQHHQTNPRLT
jgi:hypothetical protein